jgi:hypothetical protein
MAILTGTAPQSLEEWVTEVYYGSYRDRRQSIIYDRINRIETSVRAFEEKWYVSGVGSYFQKGEGGAVIFDDIIQGSRTRITMLTYALGIRITMEMREDDRWEVIDKLPADLADAGMDHMERLGHDVWNNAFTTTKYTATDMAALCSTSHSALKSGIVRSNSGTNDFTHAGLEASLIQLMLLTDENGRFIPMNPDTLLIHPSKLYEAQRLLESRLEPFTTDNQINTMQSSRTGISIVASPYLTNQDNYFLFDSKLLDVRFFRRKGMTPNTSTDDTTFDMKMTSHYRAGVGVWNWEAVYGNSPP